ncbi:MAG: hypothetical protein KAW45_02550 [Thermoplasmatales archaeon]|nr:hypothetical protein [Thermoplasmatales archaeon]
MKKKILIAGFFAVILLLVPFTAVGRNGDICNLAAIEPKDESLTIELTMEELSQTYTDFKNVLKEDHPELYQDALQAFSAALTLDRNGVVEVDLEEYKSGLEGISVQTKSYISKPMGYDVNGFKQETVRGPFLEKDGFIKEKLPYFGLPDIENYSKEFWETIVRPWLNNKAGDDIWPAWRTDNDDYDGDGPLLAGEEDPSNYDNYKDGEGEKYDYQGLDDYMDWHCNAGLWWLLKYVSLALTLCLIFLILIVGLIGLISVILGLISCGYLFEEAFDFKDHCYGSSDPSTKDGL